MKNLGWKISNSKKSFNHLYNFNQSISQLLELILFLDYGVSSLDQWPLSSFRELYVLGKFCNYFLIPRFKFQILLMFLYLHTI